MGTVRQAGLTRVESLVMLALAVILGMTSIPVCTDVVERPQVAAADTGTEKDRVAVLRQADRDDAGPVPSQADVMFALEDRKKALDNSDYDAHGEGPVGRSVSPLRSVSSQGGIVGGGRATVLGKASGV